MVSLLTSFTARTCPAARIPKVDCPELKVLTRWRASTNDMLLMVANAGKTKNVVRPTSALGAVLAKYPQWTTSLGWALRQDPDLIDAARIAARKAIR